jgi:toxin ParE1/3/4
MVTINWTELAVQDLRDIHDYIAKDSKFYADRYIDKLID